MTLRGRKIQALKTKHSDPFAIGFKIYTDSGAIYTSDTEYFKGIEQYLGSRIMILNVTRPNGDKIPFHLSTEDAEYCERVNPEVAVITHIGYKMHIKARRRKTLHTRKYGH